MEYIRSAFLVQEWETAVNGSGSKKETLRLDLIDSSYDAYKDADVLVFNTGNWWTHEKTSQGYLTNFGINIYADVILLQVFVILLI